MRGGNRENNIRTKKGGEGSWLIDAREKDLEDRETDADASVRPLPVCGLPTHPCTHSTTQQEVRYQNNISIIAHNHGKLLSYDSIHT